MLPGDEPQIAGQGDFLVRIEIGEDAVVVRFVLVPVVVLIDARNLRVVVFPKVNITVSKRGGRGEAVALYF